MTSDELLLDIRDFIDAALNDNLTEAERARLRFANGAAIVAAINSHLHEVGPVLIEGEFDPYTDEETRKMLERAGIATHRYR